MRITFINHASVLIQSGGIRLLTDPWLTGTVFQHGWSHLTASALLPAQLGHVTHIWFSHEHPDHFHPPDLKQIPEVDRARITILYPRTEDGKVATFCRRLGFKDVIELEACTWHDMGDGIRLRNDPAEDDSWLLIDDGRTRLLNVNDCVLRGQGGPLDQLARELGRIDVLLTQFSYAQWEGNPDQPEKRQQAGARKLKQMEAQVRAFRPTHVIPFASYVRFCHAENTYMNDHPNRVRDVATHLTAWGCTPVVLFPGDAWEAGSPHDNGPAIQRWEEAVKRAAELPLLQSRTVPMAELDKAMARFQAGARTNMGWPDRFRVPPLMVRLTDTGQVVRLHVTRGLREMPAGSPADITMSSEVLHFCLAFDWGFNTTHVNGRFTVASPHGMDRYMAFELIGNRMNHGHRLPGMAARIWKRLTT